MLMLVCRVVAARVRVARGWSCVVYRLGMTVYMIDGSSDWLCGLVLV